MATTRPQVAGTVDPPVKDRIDRLPLPMSKVVEYCVLAGLSRILAKVYVRKLFRAPVATEATDLRLGQTALTGLNEFR